jgi:glycosyltransferase involved in cell wall biosynthesis
MIQSGIPADRCCVTYNSMLSPPHERPGRRGLLQFDVPEKAFVVGSIANMRAVKGIDILLRAAMRVADLDIYWLLMGNVHDPLVRKLAGDPRIRDRVRLVGFRPRASELISGADLFVMPSRAEALCQALLEAMCQGVCPIVSDAGGMKEVVRHEQDGLVVPRENPAALADAIRSLYHDRTRMSRFAVSSRQRVLDTFSVEKLALRMLQMYREELSGKLSVASRAAA